MAPQNSDRLPPTEADLEKVKNFQKTARNQAMLNDAHDADGDGKLDYNEFSKLVREREMGIFTEQAMRKRFNSLDADGSGTIERQEFMVFVLNDTVKRSGVRVVDLFKGYDSDGSLALDRAEFHGFLRQLGFDARKEEIDSIFDLWDYDRSGTLSLTESSASVKTSTVKTTSSAAASVKLTLSLAPSSMPHSSKLPPGCTASSPRRASSMCSTGRSKPAAIASWTASVGVTVISLVSQSVDTVTVKTPSSAAAPTSIPPLKVCFACKYFNLYFRYFFLYSIIYIL